MKIVIAGAGSVGRYLVERLSGERHDISVIDHDGHVLEELSSSFDIQTFLGTASSFENLKVAGLAAADIFVAATNSDETNIVAGLLAESINKNVRRIARIKSLVTDESGLSQNIAAAFDKFIDPAAETVSVLRRLFEVPGAVEIMEFCGGRVWVVGVMITDHMPLVKKKLKDFPKIFEWEQALIVGIARDGQVIIPRGDDEVQIGDEVYIAAASDRMSHIFRALGLERRPIRNVMLYGGGSVGSRLARELSQQNIKVKLIEPDPVRSELLASELSNVLVLQGDATDQELLVSESISDADVFVGATDDEENNILSTLLAKRLGARIGAVVVTKASYLNLISEIGVDIVVSPHIAAASSILKFVRQSSVSTVFSTRDDSAEVLEIEAANNSRIVGESLQNVKLPSGVIAAAVYSDAGVIIPHGNTTILPGQRIVFFVKRQALPKLQKML